LLRAPTGVLPNYQQFYQPHVQLQGDLYRIDSDIRSNRSGTARLREDMQQIQRQMEQERKADAAATPARSTFRMARPTVAPTGTGSSYGNYGRYSFGGGRAR
jgi:hypothetical protein